MPLIATDSALLTLNEVANLLRVSPHTVRAWTRSARLLPVRICRRLLFDPADVEAFVRKAQKDCQSEADASANNRSLKAVH
jgi:excisionase family DNA binding protein